MHNVPFDGAKVIGKPPTMTEEQCSAVYAAFGYDTEDKVPDQVFADNGRDVNGFPFFVTAWMPNKEDLEALNAGRPLWIKVVGNQFQPMMPFTADEKGELNE